MIQITGSFLERVLSTELHSIDSGDFPWSGKGPMTNLAGSSQARGFFGAYLKFSGFEVPVIEGATKDWVYLTIRDETIEFREANPFFLGMDTFETEEAIRKELGVGRREVSIFGIGPAGENRVRFACVVGDRGHVASKNGLGAVMGSKRLKAIVAYRGKYRVSVSDPERLIKLQDREVFEASKQDVGGLMYKWGSGGVLSPLYRTGALPISITLQTSFPGMSIWMGNISGPISRLEITLVTPAKQIIVRS